MKIRWGAWSRALFALLLAAAVSGCGPRTVADTYSFGTARVYFADSVAELVLPFELQVRREAELSAAAPSSVMAVNANRHFQTIVEGFPTEGRDLAAAEAEFTAMLRDNADADVTTSAAELAGLPAVRADYHYVQPTQGGAVPLTGRAYIVIRDGTLWRILYQYPTGDAEGEALMDAVDGRVQLRAVNKERV